MNTKKQTEFKEFKRLTEEMSNECRHWSGGCKRHKNFQLLMEFNQLDRIGFACLLLCDQHFSRMFEILYESVDESKLPPIPDYYAGRVPVIKECWRYWALHEGIVNTKYDPESYWVEDKYGNKGEWH